MRFTHASLFSGIGGFDLAAQWMGWENVAHCEINEFCLKILKYYWPDANTHKDIKTTDFTIYRGQIDILTGGFPCQPFSSAGLRKGIEDDRHLWPEMLRAIRQVQPKWVVGENVLGIVNWSEGLVFEQVHAEMEASGYEIQSFILPACSVGAPHRRDRVWFICRLISDSASNGFCGNKESKEGSEMDGNGIPFNGINSFFSSKPITDTNNKGFQSARQRNFLSKEKIKTRSTPTGNNKKRNWDGFPTKSPAFMLSFRQSGKVIESNLADNPSSPLQTGDLVGNPSQFRFLLFPVGVERVLIFSFDKKFLCLAL